MQAGDQAAGRCCAGTKEMVDKALREVVIVDLCRDKSPQSLPPATLGKDFAGIVNPADNGSPGNTKFPGQHIDAVAAWVASAKGYDDHDHRPPVDLSTKEQAGGWQYPATTIFPAAAETQTDTEFIRYIGRAAAGLSGIGSVMKGGMTERTSRLLACTGKILIYLVEYTKKTDVCKKFW